jgi:hypothetical protein
VYSTRGGSVAVCLRATALIAQRCPACCSCSVAAAAWVVLQLPALLAPSSLTGVLLLVAVGAVAGGATVLLLLVSSIRRASITSSPHVQYIWLLQA